jgi:hypothetical protein
MSDADDFRHFADECLILANDPKISNAQRKVLLEMAVAWMQLVRSGNGAARRLRPPHRMSSIRTRCGDSRRVLC